MGQDYCQDCGISIHSTTRVETGTATLKAFRFEISIHSTTRVETWQAGVLLLFSTISIHSTTRVETQARVYNALLVGFQSTPPRGWRHPPSRRRVVIFVFQSTPPRGWRLCALLLFLIHSLISINSTTRVETFYCPEGRKGKDIFQSTPPRGWRRISVVSSDLKVCISIHSTTRVETRLESNLLDISGISIHSTTRVETHDWIPLRYPPGDFNPLHHEGGDIACFPTSDILDDFNPLHHEGGDLLDLASMAPAQVISIHSTTRVETHEMCESGEIPYISIHSTTRVETPDKIGFIAEAEFQSTPPRGWRLSIGVNGLAILKFQSTPPRGWRREVPRSPLSYLLFQSTPPRGWRPGRGGGETR